MLHTLIHHLANVHTRTLPKLPAKIYYKKKLWLSQIVLLELHSHMVKIIHNLLKFYFLFHTRNYPLNLLFRNDRKFIYVLTGTFKVNMKKLSLAGTADVFQILIIKTLLNYKYIGGLPSKKLFDSGRIFAGNILPLH